MKLLSKITEILKESNIAYDYLKYEPEEKAYVAYKNSASWVRRWSLIFKVKQAKPVEVKRPGTVMSYGQDSR